MSFYCEKCYEGLLLEGMGGLYERNSLEDVVVRLEESLLDVLVGNVGALMKHLHSREKDFKI